MTTSITLIRSDFNPRSPCGERRSFARTARSPAGYFNPRSPCGERLAPFAIPRRAKRISIHVPLAGNDALEESAFLDDIISIHVPLAGNDTVRPSSASASGAFQSTFPLRGTTVQSSVRYASAHISIHVPLAGNDVMILTYCGTVPSNFNPRSPCGERPVPAARPRPLPKFQSTFPLRGTTAIYWPLIVRCKISIHVPLAGNDSASSCPSAISRNFNPRSPCGERPDCT